MSNPPAEKAPAADAGAPAGTQPESAYRWYALAVLIAVYAMNTFDRNVLSLVLQPIKVEFSLSDTQLGLLSGLVFAAAYGLAGIPLGMLIDRLSRPRFLAVLLAIWSGLTALTGTAQNFATLIATRMGIGASEAPAQPIALSLISDYFRPAQRALATGLFMTSIPLGTFLGFLVAGAVIERYGWRAGFFVAGLPGLLLAVVVATTLRDVARGHSERTGAAAAPRAAAPIAETLRYILRARALLKMIVGTVLMVVVAGSFGVWLPTFLVRNHAMSMQVVATAVAVISGLAGVIGSPLGGFIADRLGRRDVRWQPRLAALVTAASLPLMAVGLLSQTTWIAVVFATCWTVMGTMVYAPAYSLCASLAPAHMRGTTLAIMAVGSNVIGFGLGSQLVGLMSDFFARYSAPDSLRYALVALLVFKLAAATLYWRAARDVQAGLDQAVREGARSA
ncbi:MAG: spinster family MFS transporter [Gammaproteobacteria bacterium]